MKAPRSTKTTPPVRICRQKGALRAHLAGVIDVSVAEELHRNAIELAEADQDVVVDLGAVERLDASALQLLMALRQELASRRRSLTISGDGPALRSYVAKAGMSQLLGVEAGEQAAASRE